MVVIWVIGMMLGSAFEGHGAEAAGENYSTGTASFTKDSSTVVGSGTSWIAGMVGGLIMLDDHDNYFRIHSIENNTHLSLACNYPDSSGSGSYTMVQNPEWMGQSEQSTLMYLINPRNIIYQESTIGPIVWWTAPFEYFKAWGQVLIWDFSFLRGTGYELVRWIVLIPFTAAVVAGLIILFVQLLQGFLHL